MMKVVLFALVVMVSPVALAQSAADVRITNLKYAGNGCPPGSMGSSISPDGQVFTLLFDSFIAELPPMAPMKKNKKSCHVQVSVDVPKGWSYALASVDFRGYSRLEAGVNASQQAHYKMTGGTKESGARTVMSGPLDEDYALRDTAFDSLLWSKCGKGDKLQIRTEVEVTSTRSGTGGGVMTVDSVDGTVEQRYVLTWRRC